MDEVRAGRVRRGGLAAAAAAGVFALWVVAVPFPQELLSPQSVASTKILDRDGRLLREVINDKVEGRGRWIESIDRGAHVVRATVHVEDKRFYSHPGFDPIAILRAAWDNLRAGRILSGASTLTQQTVKLVMPRADRRSLSAKAMEAIWAVRLELALSKDQILAQYLNRAPYGNQLFGVEAAAQAYFGKSADQLSLAEATLLAGIPQAPALTEPLKHMQRARGRQRVVLGLMREREAISEQSYRAAISEAIVLASAQGLYRHTPKGSVRAPHFTDHVLKVTGGRGEVIQTTLDLELQEKVEGIAEAHLENLEGRHVSQAAALVLDNRSGEVLAWVGSRDYWDAKAQGANDGVMALRQPGSTLKPFVYGLYLERGGTAADVMADLPTQIPTDTGVYIPKNYDQDFHGPVSVRDALGSSLNIPAVLVGMELGVPAVLARLHALGFESLGETPDHYGPGLALGNGEVRMYELATAYAALARTGRWRQSTVIKGQRRAAKDVRLMSKEVSYILMDVLSDDKARAIGFGLDGPLMFPYRVAAKTGTSTDFKDNWAVGITPDHTVAVWVGNFDGSAMQKVSGSTGASPILRGIFQALNPSAAGPVDVPWPPTPRGVKAHSVCTLSGLPITEHCPAARRELFEEGRRGASARPGVGGDRPPGPAQCTQHVAVPIDTRNGLRAGPGCDPEWVREEVFHALPPELVEWAMDNGLEAPPRAWSHHCPGGDEGVESAPGRLQIVHPLPSDRFVVDKTAPPESRRITFRATSALAATGQRLTWFVDGEALRQVGPPYTTTWLPRTGSHRIGLGRERVEVEVQIEVR